MHGCAFEQRRAEPTPPVVRVDDRPEAGHVLDLGRPVELGLPPADDPAGVLRDPVPQVRARRHRTAAVSGPFSGREPRAVLGDQVRGGVRIGVFEVPDHGASIGFDAWRRPRS